MAANPTQELVSPLNDGYRGVQYEMIVKGSGSLTIVGAVAALALLPFYPPTAVLGMAGWLIVAPICLFALGLGLSYVTLRRRPGMTAIYVSSFAGIAFAGFLQWMAGAGEAPYLQLLLLPVLGSGQSQTVRTCVAVLVSAGLVALTPMLYSDAPVDIAATAVEFALLSTMTLMTSIVGARTREHRAQLKDAGEHAHTLAHIDSLTGMLNRRAFDEELAHAIEAMRHNGTNVSLLLSDVNSFKAINDTFGHAAGDEVLEAIATALSDAVRRPDVAFRWAGDEFAVILRDTDEAGAGHAAARLREAVQRTCRRPDGLEVTIATGVAQLYPNMSTDDAIRAADAALYHHKAQRKAVAHAA